MNNVTEAPIVLDEMPETCPKCNGDDFERHGQVWAVIAGQCGKPYNVYECKGCYQRFRIRTD